MEVQTVKVNKPLQRKEIALIVTHPRLGTPSKSEISTKICSLFKVKNDFVVVQDCKNKFGTHEMKCNVKVYDSLDVLKAVEKKSILKSKFNIEKKRKIRRVRKDEKKKKAKMFGTLRRNIRKAEKKAMK